MFVDPDPDVEAVSHDGSNKYPQSGRFMLKTPSEDVQVLDPPEVRVH